MSIFDIIMLSWTCKKLRSIIINNQSLKNRVQDRVLAIKRKFSIRKPYDFEFHTDSISESYTYYPSHMEIGIKYESEIEHCEFDIILNKFFIKDGYVNYDGQEVGFYLGIFRIGSEDCIFEKGEHIFDGRIQVYQDDEQLPHNRNGNIYESTKERFESINKTNNEIIEFLTLVTIYLGCEEYISLIMFYKDDKINIFHHPGNPIGFPPFKIHFVEFINEIYCSEHKEFIPIASLQVFNSAICPVIIYAELVNE